MNKWISCRRTAWMTLSDSCYSYTTPSKHKNLAGTEWLHRPSFFFSRCVYTVVLISLCVVSFLLCPFPSFFSLRSLFYQSPHFFISERSTTGMRHLWRTVSATAAMHLHLVICTDWLQLWTLLSTRGQKCYRCLTYHSLLFSWATDLPYGSTSASLSLDTIEHACARHVYA